MHKSCSVSICPRGVTYKEIFTLVIICFSVDYQHGTRMSRLTSPNKAVEDKLCDSGSLTSLMYAARGINVIGN